MMATSVKPRFWRSQNRPTSASPRDSEVAEERIRAAAEPAARVGE